MSRAAVIGETLRIYGYGMAGALLCPASDRQEAVRALRDLPGDVAVVVLTMKAARWLADELATRPAILPVILPEPAWPAAKSAIAQAPP